MTQTQTDRYWFIIDARGSTGKVCARLLFDVSIITMRTKPDGSPHARSTYA